MRFQRVLSIAAVLFLTARFASAQINAATTRPAVAMIVAPDGTLTITLGGKPVAMGHWQIVRFPYQNLDADEIALGPIVSTTVKTDSPTHAVVTDTYTAGKATSDIMLDGEDIRYAVHLENQDKTKSLKHNNFVGLGFHFDKPATGTLPSWHWSYLAVKGMLLFHPSLAEPIGCVYAHDDQFGFAMHSSTEFEHLAMFNAEFEQNGIIPADCRFQFLTTCVVPPGQAIDVDADFRISADTSVTHLMGGYKKIYDQHFPALLYHPDNRPVAAFTGVGDQRTVSRGNPYGFISPMRRLDSAVGTSAYIRLIAPPLETAHALGIIFWSPGGYRAPMYPPDFDLFPDAVQQNIPTLVEGFKKHGLRVGLCARCGDGVTREKGKDPVVFRLSADKPADMKTLMDRFHHAMDMGFDLFYLDSFGNDGLNDQEILKQIRASVGPDVQLYTEFGTDLSLPYAGRYCEWEGGNALSWTSPEQYQDLKFLCPDSVWLCIAKSGKPIPPEFAKLGLTPLVSDLLSNRLPEVKAK